MTTTNTTIPFRCAECGLDFERWEGRCGRCGAWGSIEAVDDAKVQPGPSPAEAREEFYRTIWNLVRYWSGEIGNVPDDMPTKERVSGVVFSLLVNLDGCGGLDGRHTVVRTHDGGDWTGDGAMLHDGFYPERKPDHPVKSCRYSSGRNSFCGDPSCPDCGGDDNESKED